MAGRDLTRRLAHNAGFCSLAYAPAAAKDRILVTCGNDDLVKLHDLEKGRDDEGGVNEVDHFEDSVYAVAVSPDGTRIAAGGEGKVAVLFKVEDGGADYERNATKSTLPIRDLSFSPDGARLAVASDDDEIRVVHVENKDEVVTLRGHEGGVKSVAFDPKGEYLASSGSDRSVRLWLLETGNEFKKLSQVFGKVPATDVENGNPINLCQLAWSPDGEFLAVAGSKDVKILERASLKEVDACAGAHEHEVSIVQFSSNGLYLLSVDVTGLIVVWEFQSRESLQRYKNGSRVLAAKWDPFANTIAAISIKGEYGLIDDVVPDSKPGPNDKRDDEDVNSEIAQEDGFGEIRMQFGDGLEPAGGVQWEGEPMLDARGSFAVARRQPPQPPFQPQSTPAVSKRRFLSYTSLGQITSRDETTYHVVEIEFADVNTGRPIRFNDYNGFTMAAMSVSGAVFASPEVEERGGNVTESSISFKPFDAWTPQSEWSMSLDKGEEAQAVAVGSSFVAVATSKRMLRLFTMSGVQTRIIMLRGPILCMHGLGDQLAVLCHSPCSPGADGSQDVHFEWLNVESKTMLASGAVCLSPEAKDDGSRRWTVPGRLEWLQLTDLGFLAIMDSAGIISVYSSPGEHASGHWSPVLDVNSLEKAKKMHKRDWFWPVAITSDDIIGVLVKNEKRYPDTQLPVMTKFPLSIPMLSGTTEQEESFLRKSFFTDRLAAIAMDEEDEAVVEAARLQLEKSLLQQINAACSQKKLARALDLAKFFSTERGVAAAATLANRHRLTNLAERIDMYRQLRFQEQEEVEYEEVGDEVAYQEPAAKRSKHQHHVRQQQEEDEDDDSRQQMDEEDDAQGSPSAKSTAETPPAPIPSAVQRRPGMASLFASAKSKPAAASVPPAKAGFMEKLASIKAAAASAATPGMRQKVPTFGIGRALLGKAGGKAKR